MLKLSFSLQIDFTRHNKVLCTTSNVTARSPQELPNQPHPVPRGSRCRSALWPYNTKCASAASLRRCMVCIDMPLFDPTGRLCSLQFGEKSTETVNWDSKKWQKGISSSLFGHFGHSKGASLGPILVYHIPRNPGCGSPYRFKRHPLQVQHIQSQQRYPFDPQAPNELSVVGSRTLEHQVTRHLAAHWN